jgi:thioredoxin 1
MRQILFLIFLFGFTISCKKENLSDSTKNDLKDITSLTEFESSIKSGVSLVFFHASWCPKCASQRPAVEGLTSESELSNVFFGEVEFEDHSDIVSKYEVFGFPTIVIYKDSVEKARFDGQGHSQKSISDKVKEFL